MGQLKMADSIHCAKKTCDRLWLFDLEEDEVSGTVLLVIIGKQSIPHWSCAR